MKIRMASVGVFYIYPYTSMSISFAFHVPDLTKIGIMNWQVKVGIDQIIWMI